MVRISVRVRVKHIGHYKIQTKNVITPHLEAFTNNIIIIMQLLSDHFLQ